MPPPETPQEQAKKKAEADNVASLVGGALNPLNVLPQAFPEARAKILEGFQKQRMQLSPQVAKNYTNFFQQSMSTLQQNPQDQQELAMRLITGQLQSIQTMTRQNAQILRGTTAPGTPGATGGQGVESILTSSFSTQSRDIEAIINALCADPPAAPGIPWQQGDRIERASGGAERYLEVIYNGTAFRMDFAKIQQDIKFAQSLLPLAQGNAQVTGALQTLLQRLDAYAQQAPGGVYAQHYQFMASNLQGRVPGSVTPQTLLMNPQLRDMAQRDRTSEGLAFAGKAAGFLALGALALVDTTIALLNGRVPTVGPIAGIAAWLIADSKARNRLLRGEPLAIANEIGAVLMALDAPVLGANTSLASRYELFRHAQWETVLEELMRNSKGRWIEKLEKLRKQEGRQRGTQEFITDLGASAGSPVHSHLLRMIDAQTDPRNPITDFDRLLNIICGKSRNSQTGLIDCVRRRRTSTP